MVVVGIIDGDNYQCRRILICEWYHQADLPFELITDFGVTTGTGTKTGIVPYTLTGTNE